jgi:hypothetical protein
MLSPVTTVVAHMQMMLDATGCAEIGDADGEEGIAYEEEDDEVQQEDDEDQQNGDKNVFRSAPRLHPPFQTLS